MHLNVLYLIWSIVMLLIDIDLDLPNVRLYLFNVSSMRFLTTESMFLIGTYEEA